MVSTALRVASKSTTADKVAKPLSAFPKSKIQQYQPPADLLIEHVKSLESRVTGLKEQALLDSQCQEVARQIEARAHDLIRRYEAGEVDLKLFEKQRREILGAAAAIGLSLLILSNFNPVARKGSEIRPIANSVQPQVQNLFSPPAQQESINSTTKLDSPIKSLAELKALFAHPKAPGAIAIGNAEGNYDLKGNRLKGWYGHSDPGDNKYNKGFCSIAPGRGDHFDGGSPEEADAACIRMLDNKLDKVFGDFERAGAQLTLERAINSLDLYNQASPDVSRRFPGRLVEYEGKSTGVDLIADARTSAFYKGNRNTATGLLGICRRENRPVSDWQCVRGDQMRRAKAIRKSLNSLPAIASPTIPAQPETKSFFSGIASWFSKPNANEKYSAESIIKFMEAKGYQITRHPEEVNIVHLRNGIEARDQFEDWRMIIQFDTAGKPHITGKWRETTKPGRYIVKTTRRSGGALTVAPGQWKYQVGIHYGETGRHAHEALVQASPSKGFRDSNRDGTPDTPVWGKFWTNTHAPWSDGETVQDRSAGCNVTQTKKAHSQFMEMVKRDRRFIQNPQHIFLATIINVSDLGLN